VIFGLKVFALGGGTGLSALLAGLKHFVNPPPKQTKDALYFADLAALVTVTNDSGSSGRFRDEFQMLPPDDIRNCLVAISADESLLSSLFQYRFDGEGDLGGHNFGDLFLKALTSVTGDFHEAVRAASHVLAIDERIFPSTNENIAIGTRLVDGSTVREETNISRSAMKIENVFFAPPECEAPPEALEALQEVDLILVGAGSLYTSLAPNLLVPGIARAIVGSETTVVLLANIMTQPGETSGFTLADHVNALLDHCPDLELSYILANDEPIADEVLARYREDGEEAVVLSVEEDLLCPLVVEDLLHPGSVIRHDGIKTARALKSLFHRERVRPQMRGVPT
jgi:uncharacterized cofD-like protein